MRLNFTRLTKVRAAAAILLMGGMLPATLPLSVATAATPCVPTNANNCGVQDIGLFELDGNTKTTTPTGITCPPNDWAALYTVDPGGTDKPCGSDGWSFTTDGVSPTGVVPTDNSYWSGGGSKDAYDPALGPWNWGPGDVAADKDQLEHAFAAAYHLDTTTTLGQEHYLYFGSDRYADNGSAQQGFWFLQSPVCLAGPVTAGSVTAPGTCPSTTPNTGHAGSFVDPATGQPIHHKQGDLLILVNFSSGGTLGLAGVFRWDCNPGGCATGGSPTQVLFGNGADCQTIADPNNFCSTTDPSGNGLPGEPVWTYTAKSGGTSYPQSSFVEGGVNLNEIPGAGTCFPTFIAETRSSSGPSTGLSLQAQLKDLTLASFQTCGSSTVTTPQDGSGTTVGTGNSTTGNSASTVSVGTGSTGVDVQDSAQVTVSGTSSFDGTVAFHICGPTPVTSTATCDTGGVPITGGSASPPSPSTVVSSKAHLTEAGRYCWRADYSGDAAVGVPASSDHSLSECFAVTPVTPTLATQAVDANGNNITAPVNFGTEIFDTATLTGTAYEPGTGGPSGSDGSINPGSRTTKAQGSITFKLYGPDTVNSTTNCNTLAAGFPSAGIVVNVNGDSPPAYGGPTSNPVVGFTPASPGIYHWKASYGGDLPNTTTASHNDTCNDANEDVTVQQVPTTTTTNQFVYPQDKAKIAASAGGNLSGTVYFRLFDNATDCQADPAPASTNQATGLLFASSSTISGASGATAETNNTTAAVTNNTTVYWNVTYTSTNPAQLGSSSSCAESTTVMYLGDDSTISVP